MAVLAVGLAVWWWVQGQAEPSNVMTAQPGEVAAVSAPAQSPGSVLLLDPTLGPVTSGSPAPGSQAPSATGPSTTSVVTGGSIVVDVRGAVLRPGLLSLPPGSRVSDAIDAAGGLRPGRRFGPVNLARLLADGEQIIVGRSRAPAPGQTETLTGTPSATIDINHASSAELEELPGVGPVLAARIVEWRTANGPFRTVEDLLEVSGIGEATLASMRSKLRVG